jgi:FKBP-type peptidyl-prolyl cis-trans isomerase FklB
MKYLPLLLIVGIVAAGCSKSSDTPPDLETNKDTVSYGLGYVLGSNVKAQFFGDSLDFDMDLLARGMEDGFTKDSGAISRDMIMAALTAFQQKRVEMIGKKNLAAGEKFLAENKGKPGVQTTATGLQYKVVREGSGASPKATDVVVVHYRGTLLNGKEFDNSYKRNQPATFNASGVIPGWTEMLQLMKTGSKVTAWIPSRLAYGTNGAGDMIGPNEMLTFEIELVGIQPPQAAQPGMPPAHP